MSAISVANRSAAKKTVTPCQVEQLFTECKLGQQLKPAQYYSLANVINVVVESRDYKPDKALNDDAKYRRRRTILNAMRRLIREQKQAHELHSGLLQPLQTKAAKDLAALEIALGEAEEALLSPFDPLAGERSGARWHKAARFIADKVEGELRAAGHKTVSRQKGGSFVLVIIGALALIGQTREPGAVAAALAKSPT